MAPTTEVAMVGSHHASFRKNPHNQKPMSRLCARLKRPAT